MHEFLEKTEAEKGFAQIWADKVSGHLESGIRRHQALLKQASWHVLGILIWMIGGTYLVFQLDLGDQMLAITLIALMSVVAGWAHWVQKPLTAFEEQTESVLEEMLFEHFDLAPTDSAAVMERFDQIRKTMDLRTRGSFEVEFCAQFDGVDLSVIRETTFNSKGADTTIRRLVLQWQADEPMQFCIKPQGELRQLFGSMRGAKRTWVAEGISEPQAQLFDELLAVLGQSKGRLDDKPQLYALAQQRERTVLVEFLPDFLGERLVRKGPKYLEAAARRSIAEFAAIRRLVA